MVVTSASIDVVTTASEYTEERKQYSLSYAKSTESDYIADTIGLSLSQ